jgi:hypothetical protein
MIRHQNSIKELSEKNSNWSYPESLGAILYGLGNVMIRYKYEPFMQFLKMNPDLRGLMSGDNLKNEQLVVLVNNCIVDFNK